MEIKEMTMEQVETRTNEVMDLLKDENADLNALEIEINELEERKAQIKQHAEERKAQVEEIINKAETVQTFEKEEVRQSMNEKELRSSREYVNAYAEWLKTGSDKEMRKVLSDLAPESSIAEGDGIFPTPVYLEERIQTAWERDDISRRVPRLFIRGTYKVGFELSATDAAVHAEGAAAPAQEQLAVGVIELKPESIKKWITVTDEVLDLKGEAFLDYLFDEIEYKIVKKSVEELLDDIIALPAVSSATEPAVATITEAPDVNTILNAMVLLSDSANNPVVVMNKLTYATFRGLTTQLGTRYEDIFEGLEVVFNNHLPAFSAANAGDVYAIVGDFNGARFNFPNGSEVTFKYDDLSLAELDLVKIVGRMYVGHGVVTPNFFTTIKKPA